MAVPLPDPAEHPILLFDGVCNLCHGVVRFVIRRDPEARFRFAPLQSEPGLALRKRFGLGSDAIDSVVLIDARGAHRRSDAALGIVRAIGAPWSWLGVLAVLPRRLRDAAYGFVASRRYRWFGRRDACPLPSPELRARFLA